MLWNRLLLPVLQRQVDGASNTMWVESECAGMPGKYSLPGEPVAGVSAAVFPAKALIWERDPSQDVARLSQNCRI